MLLDWNKLLLFCVFGLLLLSRMGGNEAQAQCPTINLPPVICAGDNCGAGTPFTVSGDTVGITRYEWDFGVDGTDADTSSLKFPSFRYDAPGQYNGTLTITRNGVAQKQTCPFTVNVLQGVPEFDITPDDNLGPQDEEICKGSTATLTPQFRDNQQPPPNATYLWSTGQTTQTLTVPDTVGCYSLTITDPATGCSRSQKINITVYKPDPNNPPPPKEESRWYFGNGAGIKFVGGNPEAITGNINAPEGVSAVSGSTGQLLFYTDGRNVYDKSGAFMKDRNGQDVTGANALNGGLNATQGVLIIAQPGCNDCDPVYYVFTTSDIGPNGSQLSYSVVDMRLNNGLGEVTLKNAPLFSTSTERVVGVRGQADPNDQNAQETTWIITHDFNTNTFRVYPLTPQGIGQPKTYDVGEVHGPETVKGESYMKVYDDKIVVTIPGANGGPNVVQIFEFDNTTGEVKENPLTLTLGPVPPNAPLYGVELHGDSLLYVSTRGSGSTPSKLIQFNLARSIPDSIVKYQVVLDSSLTEPYGALQVDPNGQKIYLAKENSSSLGVINSPGTVGEDADFQPNGLALTGGQSKLGLPNTAPPDNQGYGQDFSYDDPPCTPPNTPVQITFRAQPDRAGGDPTKSTYLWRFPNNVTYVTDSVQHTFPGPGTYTVGLTIFNDCIPQGEVIPDKTIVIPVAPPPVSLRDTSVCAGATVRLEAYPNQAGPQGVTYTWRLPNGGSRTGKAIDVTVADVTPDNSTFTVVVANDTCAQSASARVNFTQIPVDLGADTTLCEATTLLLNAGNPGMRYQWKENGTVRTETGQTLSVRPAPGSNVTYEVTVTDPLTGCSNTDQIVVRRGAKPNVIADVQPTSSCDPLIGNGVIDIISSDADAAGFQYEWSKDGVTIPLAANVKRIDNAAVGVYQIRVSNPAGCDTTLTVPVNADPNTADPPEFRNLEPVVTLTCDGNASFIDGTADSPAGGLTYIWRNQANETVGTDPILSSDNVPPGIYSITVTDAAGCAATGVAEFRENPNSPQVIIAEPIPTGCDRILLQAVLTGRNNDPSKFTFQWFRADGSAIPSSNSDTLTVSGTNQTAQYSVQVTSIQDAACAASATTPVTFPAVPAYDYGPNPAATCAGESVLLNADQGEDYWDTYIWTLPGGTTFNGAQYTATTGGTYQLTVRNSQTGCQRTDEVVVTINPRPTPPSIPNPAPVCAGGGVPQISTQLQGLRWYADPGLTRQLSTGPSTPSFLPPVDPNRPGTYTYFVTQTVNGCESRPTAVTLTIGPNPQLDLGPDRNVCQGETVVLNATSRVPGPATYLWENGLTTPTINATRTGTYRVTVTLGACTVTDEVTLTFVAAPQTSIPRREVPLCTPDGETTATLDAGPGANFTYQWRRVGSNTVIGTTQTITVSGLGAYTVAIDNGGSCIVNDTIRVVDKCEPRLFVPEAFIPASLDPKNQSVLVFGKYVGEIEMLIYNRWGELIHAQKGNSLDELNARAWDGTYLGKPAPTGTYVWKITYRSQYYPDRDPITLRGGILLVR